MRQVKAPATSFPVARRLIFGAGSITAEIRPFTKIQTDSRKKGAKYVHCPGEGQARRLDMHRFAVPKFENAPASSLELRAASREDAMLSQDEAVFSVPAVTQWRVDEMADFVECYLKGRPSSSFPMRTGRGSGRSDDRPFSATATCGGLA